MAKKQTRRSVSIRGETYDRIKQYCDLTEQSMSDFIEQRVASFFEAGRKAKVPALRPEPARIVTPAPAGGNGPLDRELADAARFFTF